MIQIKDLLVSNPIVSVIIPCYNVSLFVEEAIQSILNQSYTNLEIWIINDASTDETLQKIKRFKDDRVVVKSYRANTQKVGAVNEVLSLVRGDFICFQDADDWSEPDRIKKQLEAFESDTTLGICFTGYRSSKSKKNFTHNIALDSANLRREFLEFGLHHDITGKLPTLCATMMITKDVLLKTGGYHPYFAGKVAEDIHWVYRILKSFHGVTVPHPLYIYRSREGSFSQIQASGQNAKYAYSWHLLSKIIHKDIKENRDMLAPGNSSDLKNLELEACEEMLLKTIVELNRTRAVYEQSVTFKVGSFILLPWKIVRSMFKK